MSYQPVGSYYTFQPHQVYGTSGLGEYYEPVAASGFGGFGAAGAIGFDAATVWANVQASDVCYGPGVDQTKLTPAMISACNYAGSQAIKAIQAGLNALGYGPVPVDGNVSSPWQGPWKKFLADFGMVPGPGFGITQQGLVKMEQLIGQGATPGPNKPVSYQKVGNQYIPPGQKPTTGGAPAIASMGAGGILLGLLVLGGIGYAAYKAGHKKKAARYRPNRATTTTRRHAAIKAAKSHARGSRAAAPRGHIETVKGGRRFGHIIPPKRYWKMGATAKSDYAWPEGYKYPLVFRRGGRINGIETQKHCRTAMSRFSRDKGLYPKKIRRTIARNMLRTCPKYVELSAHNEAMLRREAR